MVATFNIEAFILSTEAGTKSGGRRRVTSSEHLYLKTQCRALVLTGWTGITRYIQSSCMYILSSLAE